MSNFLVTDPSGNEYPVRGLIRFAIEHNLNFECLRLVATGQLHHHKGWKCVYTDLAKKAKADIRIKERLERRGWVIITPKGKKLLTTNLNRFCRRHKLNYYNMRQSAVNYTNCQGYRCFYASKRKRSYFKEFSNRWEITNSDGLVFRIKSLKMFCKEQNIDYKKLLYATRKQEPYQGWKCKSTRPPVLRQLQKIIETNTEEKIF